MAKRSLLSALMVMALLLNGVAAMTPGIAKDDNTNIIPNSTLSNMTGSTPTGWHTGAWGAASEDLPRLSYYDRLERPMRVPPVRAIPSWT